MPRIDFQTTVIERSAEVPVVVDFWAAWCGPCRTLGPIIEELASAADGRWELVKLDTEAQPEIAQAFDIRGIPAVKMFHHGRVVAEFVGALPAGQIRGWLDENLPDPAADRLATIAERWPATDLETWAADLEAFVETHPEVPRARLLLAQALVATDPARARELIASVDPAAEVDDLVADLTVLVELVSVSDIPENLSAPMEGARQALRANDLDAALEHLVDATASDRKFGDDLSRRAAVALFHLLGQAHELTRKHQRRLAMVINV